MGDYMRGTEMVASGIMPEGTMGLSFPETPRDETTIADATGVELPQTSPEVGNYLQQWTQAGPQDMDPRWHKLWDSITAELREALAKLGGKSVLGYLFSRIGNDCGRYLAALHKMRISWGTYQDAMC